MNEKTTNNTILTLAGVSQNLRILASIDNLDAFSVGDVMNLLANTIDSTIANLEKP